MHSSNSEIKNRNLKSPEKPQKEFRANQKPPRFHNLLPRDIANQLQLYLFGSLFKIAG